MFIIYKFVMNVVSFCALSLIFILMCGSHCVVLLISLSAYENSEVVELV